MYYDVPDGSELQVKLNVTNLSACSPWSAAEDDEHEGHWVLEGIERTLVGNGSHRVVQSTVTLSGPRQSLHDSCELRLLERLPSGVFADRFELQGIQRRGGMIAAMLQVVSNTGISIFGMRLEVLEEVVRLVIRVLFITDMVGFSVFVC